MSAVLIRRSHLWNVACSVAHEPERISCRAFARSAFTRLMSASRVSLNVRDDRLPPGHELRIYACGPVRSGRLCRWHRTRLDEGRRHPLDRKGRCARVVHQRPRNSHVDRAPLAHRPLDRPEPQHRHRCALVFASQAAHRHPSRRLSERRYHFDLNRRGPAGLPRLTSCSCTQFRYSAATCDPGSVPYPHGRSSRSPSRPESRVPARQLPVGPTKLAVTGSRPGTEAEVATR
jgi:hypothetical protein